MSDTRERIVVASADLFRRNGYTGTGVKQIVAAANAPFGSLYHFFPGGKIELAAATIRWSARTYLDLINALFDPEPDLAIAVRDAFLAIGETLRETDYANACPIATIALEVASTNETLRRETEEAFTSWIDAVAERFTRAGLGTPAAVELAITLIGALEGAFVLCRSMRTTLPLEIASRTMSELVRRTLDDNAAGGH